LDWEALAQKAMERKKALLKGPRKKGVGQRRGKAAGTSKRRHLKKAA